ncbi:MAG: TonB-dependent receptor [Terriglobales bacterium]
METPSARFSSLTAQPVLAAITFSILLALTPVATLAATQEPGNPLKELTLEQLGNVQVTTLSKEPEEVRKTSAAIYVITNEDIQRSGVTNIPDALRLAPGVEVAQIDSNKWSIGIRGFGSRLSRDVLVLIDGRTVYTTLLAGTYWEVQNVLLEDVDHIEVIRGPGGTIWGPNAVNGVINIITKKSKDTHGTLVSVGGGSVDQGFLNARYGGSANKVDYRIYALGFVRSAEFHTDRDNFDAWRGAQVGFRTDWTESNRDAFTFEGDIYDEGAGESVVATIYAPPYQQVLDGAAHLSGGNFLARWQRTLGEGNDFQLQAYYDRTDRHELNFADYRSTVDIDFLDRFRLRARQQISWGLGARLSLGYNPVIVSGLTFLPMQRTDKLFTAFLQDEIGILKDRLSLSLGTKFLRTNFTGLQLEPSARLLWTPTDKQTLWASFTHAVRTPSAAERAFSLLGFIEVTPPPQSLPYFARFNPNPNFRSEQLNGYELGYRRLIGKKVYLDVSTFYNHYSDLFSEDIIGATFMENSPPPPHLLLPADFGNGLLGTTEGVEIAPEWKPTNFWRLWGSYSFLEMHIKRSPGSLDVEPPSTVQGSSPQHQVGLQSDLDFAKHFSLDLTYRYVSAVPAQAIPAYSTVDAHFAWRVRQQFELSVVGQNLLQPHHFEAGGDPGPLVGIKRNVYGQITWKR